MSYDLNHHLAKPLVGSEMEYAPNVVGRFNADRTDFTPYPVAGLRGIPLSRSVQHRAFAPKAEQEQSLQDSFQRSYDELAQKYGAYFHG